VSIYIRHVAIDEELLAAARAAEAPVCSFCGKPSPSPGPFVGGNGGIGICHNCVDKASRVLATGSIEATAG